MAAGRAPLLLAATLLTTAAAVGPVSAVGDPRSVRTPATTTAVYAGQGSMVAAGWARGVAAVPVAAAGLGRGPAATVLPGVVPLAGPGRVPVRGWGGGRVPSPRPVPKVSVRPPVPPKGVTVGPTVKVPRVSVRRAPRPKVSISIPNVNRRAAPEITLPHVTIYPDGVCSGAVEVGECPRRRSRAEARKVVPPAPPASLVEPVRVPPPPTPTPTPSARSHVKRLEPPARRDNPLNTVLLTVALVTVISSTTAVAFRRTR
ncbi:hypothetical protein AB0C28_07685 [Nonomuraea sp. NPDC048892]|uniref:hypothetical protein n=1 Tax=Nonomuraea sp. NPDC048892 TaxID=3154624 RepID=UPI0033DF9716